MPRRELPFGAALPLGLACALALLCACPQSSKVECGEDGQRCCEATGCTAGNECGADAVCHACGGAGQNCCTGEKCNATLECLPGGSCRACGADGEACCAGDRCGNGAECRTDALCHACGAAGQSCCGAGNCDGSLRCDNSTCVAPCGDGCAPGLKRCGPLGSVDLCTYSGPPCTAWSTLLEQCPTDQICDQGACRVRCPDACPLGALLCTSEGLKSCELDAVTQCPALVLAPVTPDMPSCMTGACDGQICWENPLPQGNALSAVVAWSEGGQIVLDVVGNVARRLDDSWTYVYRNTTTTFSLYSSMALCYPGYVVAVGRNGRAGWTDGGQWNTLDLGDPVNPLYGVGCHSGGGGTWAVATSWGGRAYKADLAAKTGWTDLATDSFEDLHGAAIYSGAGWEAFLVGDAGAILRCSTIDTAAAKCVTEAVGVATANLKAVWATSDGAQAVAVGAGGAIVQYSNAGWERTAQGLLSTPLNAVHGRDDGRFFVAGNSGAFAARDRSGNWETVHFTDADLTGVYTLDSSHLWASDGDGILWFNDTDGLIPVSGTGGWRPVGPAKPMVDYLMGVHGTSTADVYAVGAAGRVMHKSGDAWQTEAKGTTTADLAAVFAVSPQEVYAVGSAGTILARRNGAWAVEGAGVTASALMSVFADEGTVYVTGEAGTWLEKPVGGAPDAWHLVAVPTDHVLAPVTGAADGSQVWAASDDCSLLRKAGGVFTLVRVPNCAFVEFWSAWMSADGLDLYAGEGTGEIYHLHGDTWTRELIANADGVIASITGNGTDVWAVIPNAMTGPDVYSRIAGTWHSLAPGFANSELWGAWAGKDGHVYAVGGGGTIIHLR